MHFGYTILKCINDIAQAFQLVSMFFRCQFRTSLSFFLLPHSTALCLSSSFPLPFSLALHIVLIANELHSLAIRTMQQETKGQGKGRRRHRAVE
eukprot:g74033.t1